MVLLQYLKRVLTSKAGQNQDVLKQLSFILGYTPSKPDLYFLALKHNSYNKINGGKDFDSNERLEFLGDAVLGLVVADFLFKKYPFKDEGFLTDIRSRIVNRESLNELACNIGLDRLIYLDTNQRRNPQAFRSANGNALEALVGAIYIDKGYKATSKFILNKLISPNISVDQRVSNDTNYKSQLIEQVQKQAAQLKFEVIEEKVLRGGFKLFTVQVLINNEIFATGEGASKKKAEQDAAKNTLEQLQSGEKNIKPIENSQKNIIEDEVNIENLNNQEE